MTQMMDLLLGIKFVEYQMGMVYPKLRDASYHLLADQVLGTVHNPEGSERWEEFQELAAEFSTHRKRLDLLLAEIGWEGGGLPDNYIDWSAWWDAVREHASHRDGANKGRSDGVVSITTLKGR